MIRAFLLSACLGAGVSSCSTAEPWTMGGFDVSIVEPYAETPPVASADDAADDPAIWVHPSNPARSLVLGTNKKAGLHVYDLTGKEVQFLPVGNINNVDVRTIETPSGPRSYAAASNRTRQSVTLFSIAHDSGEVSVAGDIPLAAEPYGFCLGSFAAGTLNPIVTYKDGSVTLHALSAIADITAAKKLASWTLETQLEGCAVDEANDAIFVGEEGFGVWRIVHNNGQEQSRSVVDSIADTNGLVADVEGLDIWHGQDGAGYLIVSAQSADRFVVYDRLPPHQKRGIIHVGPSNNGVVDGVSHTDGLAVSSGYLGSEHPRGLLVVQDDRNTGPAAAQNFKLVDWQRVEEALELN